MTTSTVKYLGNLRTEATHMASGLKIITDAPIDNNGKGEAFSPTDLTSTSLASCMITIMGITANSRNWNLDYCECSVEKIMTSNPRRISQINLVISLNEKWNDKERKILETAANTCPVAFSLHPEIKLNVIFNYVKH
jgi:putative redox protein